MKQSSSSLETVVDVWRYAHLVMHARKNEEKTSKTYSSTEACQQALVIQSTQTVQLFHGGDECLHRRCIHEVK